MERRFQNQLNNQVAGRLNLEAGKHEAEVGKVVCHAELYDLSGNRVHHILILNLHASLQSFREGLAASRH